MLNETERGTGVIQGLVVDYQGETTCDTENQVACWCGLETGVFERASCDHHPFRFDELSFDRVSKCGKRQQGNNRNAPLSELTVADATNRVYESLQADNEDIDLHIAALKEALKREGQKEAVIDPTKLVQNNRSGRKLMQAYFRQRGVKVTFASS